MVVVNPQQQVFIQQMVDTNYNYCSANISCFIIQSFPLSAVFEGRQGYRSVLHKTRGGEGELLVETQRAWFSSLGIYNQFYTEVEGSTVRFIPAFLFGVPRQVLNWLYGEEGGGVPVAEQGAGVNRLVVQSFMNIVILTVIFLLWFHSKQPLK